MTIKKYLNMCHNIYDPIHGSKKIENIFSVIDENTLNKLVQLYNITFIERYYTIKLYAQKHKVLDENNTEFYINSIQHFMESK